VALLDDVLAANAAVVEGSDVPVPAVPENRRVVVVACAEVLTCAGKPLASMLGFSHDEALVLANAGARVQSADGDVVRSVLAAFSILDGGEVFVVAHERCEFQEADPDAAAALFASPNSSLLTALSTLCGDSFVSARRLAVSSAETLRSSPFLPRGTPIHALVVDVRGRLTLEQRGYDVAGSPASSSLVASAGLGPGPSPILTAPGPTGFGAPGPVSLFGSGPSSLMSSAPPPIAPAPPSIASAFLAPPPPVPGFTAPPPSPPSPPAPTPTTRTWDVAPTPAPVPPPLPPQPLKFDDPVPPPPPPKARDDDPFRRAAETLERLRKARKR